MNTGEILLMSLLFVAGFMATELIVSHFIYIGALEKFILRIMFLVQYSLLIYFLFDSREKTRKNNENEKNETESEGIKFKKNGEK